METGVQYKTDEISTRTIWYIITDHNATRITNQQFKDTAYEYLITRNKVSTGFVDRENATMIRMEIKAATDTDEIQTQIFWNMIHDDSPTCVRLREIYTRLGDNDETLPIFVGNLSLKHLPTTYTTYMKEYNTEQWFLGHEFEMIQTRMNRYNFPKLLMTVHNTNTTIGQLTQNFTTQLQEWRSWLTQHNAMMEAYNIPEMKAVTTKLEVFHALQRKDGSTSEGRIKAIEDNIIVLSGNLFSLTKNLAEMQILSEEVNNATSQVYAVKQNAADLLTQVSATIAGIASVKVTNEQAVIDIKLITDKLDSIFVEIAKLKIVTVTAAQTELPWTHTLQTGEEAIVYNYATKTYSQVAGVSYIYDPTYLLQSKLRGVTLSGVDFEYLKYATLTMNHSNLISETEITTDTLVGYTEASNIIAQSKIDTIYDQVHMTLDETKEYNFLRDIEWIIVKRRPIVIVDSV